MATIQTFEELEIWKEAQNLGADIYQLCDINMYISRDFSFKDQIKRAALSISNNIAEGFEYSNNNDFWRFLRIAKGSCGEVKNCLLFSIRIGFCSKDEVVKMIELCKILGKQIGKLMIHVRKRAALTKQIKSSNK